MKKPDIVENIVYDGKQIRINWFDLVGKELPDFEWKQVYVVGNIDGLVPIVHYSDNHDNLPGGKTELGESTEQTIIREMDEELKMKVISWEPLGYQEWIEHGKPGVKALRVYAKLAKDEEFVNDPGGSVVGYSLVELEKLNDYINYHEIGDRMVELTKTIR